MSHKASEQRLIKTTCPYCGVGCGIQAEVSQESRQVKVIGDQEHPANFGRLCSKGSALAETLSLDSRLLVPKMHGQSCDWDQALDAVAQGVSAIISQYGPDAVALYGSGQLLTEDYYVANKFMKGFVGTANMDTNSRLCMSSSVAGHKRAFGSDTVPGCYEDYEQAELIVLIGSNAAWCHPVSFQRIRAAKTANPQVKVVVIDPRVTASCDIADLHLPLASGTDAVLFNGLLRYLEQHHVLDQDYIAEHTEGFLSCLDAVQAYDVETVASVCGLSVEQVSRFYQDFAEHQRVMSLYSQGINQSSSGVDKVNSIINCHLATGRIGQPGMGPFSLTGQPNAMGGREVGGLSHQLAAHMDFANPEDYDRVARFWNTERLAKQPGLPAVELFDAIDAGEIKAIWIMGTNPVVSLPNADKIKQALQKCPLVIVSDCIEQTDTTAFAHILLPAAPWSEKDGTVTNSERRISRQRALLPTAGFAKPDWWIVSQVARRMGFVEQFNYDSPWQIFAEHASLSAYENDNTHGIRDFDISGLASMDQQQYEQMQPIQWPVNSHYPNGCQRMFADGHFFTRSGKAQFIAITPKLPVKPVDSEYPLRLNTGRIRDQWHTMTRTALSARLNQHRSEPYLEIHPEDAERYALSQNGLAEIQSAWGKMLARVEVTANVSPGNVFVPMHWNSQYAKSGRMGAVVNPFVDPISKQPESKHTPVVVKPFVTNWQGFVMSAKPISPDPIIDYWVKIPAQACVRYEIAGINRPDDWSASLQSWFHDGVSTDGEWLSYQDVTQGDYRMALVVKGRLQALVFISQKPRNFDKAWLESLFSLPELSRSVRLNCLSGRSPGDEAQTGPVVCACFNVGQASICQAITQQQLSDYQQVGKVTRAGTNCGSCIPEIKALLAQSSQSA